MNNNKTDVRRVLDLVKAEGRTALTAPEGRIVCEAYWTVMAAFEERVGLGADVMREHGAIGWAARNSAKPGRSGPEAWVVQAGPAWSQANLEEAPGDVTQTLMAAFAERVGSPLPGVLSATAHRWRYARSGAAGAGSLWNAALQLGVCGDWLLGPRVESAWMSGDGLAQRITQA